jgi:hypothetical protein
MNRQVQPNIQVNINVYGTFGKTRKVHGGCFICLKLYLS